MSFEEVYARSKGWEERVTKHALPEQELICARLDGKAFHTFTRGLVRPFDARLSECMIETMNFVSAQSHAQLAYTQSDEISLVYVQQKEKSQSFFGGRSQKLTSVLCSMATAKFNALIGERILEKKDTFALFDCRVWSVPTPEDALEMFYCRQQDGIKNAVSMAAHAKFGHKKVLGKGSWEKVQMLKDKGVFFEQYPTYFKEGTFVKRIKSTQPLPPELQQFASNHGKSVFERSVQQNFHTRLHPEEFAHLKGVLLEGSGVSLEKLPSVELLSLPIVRAS